MRLIKYFLVAALLCFLYLMEGRDYTADIDVAVVEKKINPDTVDGELVKGDDRQLRKLYGIDANDVEEYVLYIPGEIMSVEELLLIKAKDIQDIEYLQECVQERLENQMRSFESYGTNQIAMLKKAKVQKRGRYLFFAVSDERETWQKIFEGEIKR